MEDVATDQAEAPFEVEWRVDLPAKNRVGEARRVRVHRRDDLVGRLLAFVVPAPPRAEIIAKVLTEQARHMPPLGSERRVQRRRDQHLDDRPLGPPVHRRFEVSAVHIAEARRHDDAGRQVIALLRKHRELGKLGQSDVHPEGGAFALPPVHPRCDIAVHRASRHQPVEQELRIYAGYNVCCPPSFATCYDSGRATAGDDDLLDRMAKQDVDPRLTASPRHCLGNGAHTADRMTPGAGHAGGFTEQMVEKDIGGPGRLRRGEIADHAVETEQRLGQLTLEMPVEDVRCAANREIVDNAGLGKRQASHVAAEAKQLGDRACRAANIRRRAQQPFLEQAHHGFQLGDVAVVGVRVRFMVPPDFLAGQTAAAREQIIAVTREEIIGLAQHDLQPVPLQLHLADDFGLQQADRVARRGIAEARQELVSHRRSADVLGGLQDGDLHALLGEIICAGQAVVAGANDDCVVHLAAAIAAEDSPHQH